MRAMHRGRWRLLALLLPLTLLAAACGDDDNGDSNAGASGDTEVSGEVNVSGSSTVEPISTAVAELFQEENGDATVNVDGPGTGDGFELFCNGETDISDASRPIKQEEADACQQAGIEYIELKVGFDGISVLTNPSNDDVSCLTFADLYALIGPESEGVDNWSDAAPLASELGSSTDLPDAPLDITAPGEESGTYDSFIELAFKDIAEQRVAEGKISEDQAATTRPDYQASADDNVIVEGIEGSDTSLGWVGFAFAESAGDQVKEIEVDGGDGCTGPSTEAIRDGSYPLSRSLYVYVNKQKAADNSAVNAYVDFYLGDDGIAQVEEVGYVALPDDQLDQTRSTWEDKTTGTLESAE